MSKYRSKPRTVEAIQFTGANHQEVFDLLNPKTGFTPINWDSEFTLVVYVDNGYDMFDVANRTDWIVKYSDPEKFRIFTEEEFANNFDKMYSVS